MSAKGFVLVNGATIIPHELTFVVLLAVAWFFSFREFELVDRVMQAAIWGLMLNGAFWVTRFVFAALGYLHAVEDSAFTLVVVGFSEFGLAALLAVIRHFITWIAE